MMITVAAQLRDIAGALRAQVEEDAFGLCFEPVRADMASLPAALDRLAKEVERVKA